MGLTRAEIDRAVELVKQFDNFDIDYSELVEAVRTELNIDVDEDIESSRLYDTLMKNIEQGDFWHFKAIKNTADPDVLYVYALLLSHSSKTEEIKHLIDANKKSVWLSFFNDNGNPLLLNELIVQIAKNEGNEYIFQILNDEGEDSLHVYYKHALIEYLIDENEFDSNKRLLEYMLNHKEYVEGIKCARLISSNALKMSPEDAMAEIKSILNDSKLKEQYRLTDFGTMLLLLKTLVKVGDVQYVANIIANKNEREKNHLLGIDSSELILAIGEIKGTEFIKSILCNKEKLKDYGLDSAGEFNEIARTSLIRAVADTDGIDFVKNILENKEQREFYVLTKMGITNLLEYVADNVGTDYIKSLLTDNELAKKCEFDSDIIIEQVALAINSGEVLDTEFAEYIFENRAKYGLKAYEIINVVDDYELRNNYIKQYMNLDTSKLDSNREMIDLPSNMTVGVEIEAEGKSDVQALMNMIDILDYDWEAKPEGSLESGGEVTSPILTGNFANASDSIRKVCYMVDEAGLWATEKCGGHVHIGANYLKTEGSYKNLVELWCNVEKLMFIVCNDKGEVPREDVANYAMPISAILENLLKLEKAFVNDEEELKKYILTNVETYSKHYSLNIHNMGYTKNTIEFRAPNGTTNPDVWIENINLFGGIVCKAEELAVIQKKKESERAKEDNRMLNLFELLRNPDMDDPHKLQVFLELCIPEENHKIYVDRYNSNVKKIEENDRLKDFFNVFFTKGPIRLDEMIRKTFVGPDAVKAEDYYEGIRLMGFSKEKTKDKEINR